MYSVADYGHMIGDRVRMDAYVEALSRAVTADSIVVDVGTGTGIFALLACRFGARRVYAIERADAIQVARELASANGCADRIEFIQAMSTDVTLPEQADIVISDLGGVLPLLGTHIPSIVDVRCRLLAPTAVMIPQRDALWAAVVDAPEVYASATEPWNANTFGFDMAPARRLLLNDRTRAAISREALLAPTGRWSVLDYATIRQPDVCGTLTWTLSRAGTAHGIAMGFERTLAPGVQYSNAPDARVPAPAIYGTVFCPWKMPIAVAAGDSVTVGLEARLVQGEYIWIWRARVQPQDRDPIEFTQASLAGVPLSPESLKKSAASATRTLNEDGCIARLVLDAMEQGDSLGDIAARLTREHPVRFGRWKDALDHVAVLSRQYS